MAQPPQASLWGLRCAPCLLSIKRDRRRDKPKSPVNRLVERRRPQHEHAEATRPGSMPQSVSRRRAQKRQGLSSPGFMSGAHRAGCATAPCGSGIWRHGFTRMRRCLRRPLRTPCAACARCQRKSTGIASSNGDHAARIGLSKRSPIDCVRARLRAWHRPRPQGKGFRPPSAPNCTR